MALTLEPKKVLGTGDGPLTFLLVTKMFPGRLQAPNPMDFVAWNVETPYRSLRGQQAASSAYGGAGIGSGIKRTPFCNRADRG